VIQLTKMPVMMPITAATNSWGRLARTAPVQPAVDQDAGLLRDGEGDQAFIDSYL
jgi:hypothetical protein